MSQIHSNQMPYPTHGGGQPIDPAIVSFQTHDQSDKKY